MFTRMGLGNEANRNDTTALSLNTALANGYLERGTLYLKLGKKELAAGDFQKTCALGSGEGCAELRSLGRR